MSKQTAGIGGSFGGLIGLLIGSLIPSEGDIIMPFLGRVIDTNTMVSDPTGFFISVTYLILAVIICGALGSVIGSLFDR